MKRIIKNNPSIPAVSISSILVAIALSAAGCGGGETGPEPKVDVPEIQGAVAAEDFCALADQIVCAGALGCCAEPDFANADECLQGSSCKDGLGAVLEGSAVQGGDITYDAEKAGDYLRSLASIASQCEHHPGSLSRPTFLYGTGGEGADCTPDGSDLTNTFTCKSGLTCVVTFDAAANAPKGTCETPSGSPPPGGTDAACAEGEQCASGVCSGGKCAADIESEYCLAPRDNTPPPNADPTHLYVDLAGDNSGSSGDVTLTFTDSSKKFFRCTITDTLSDGQEKVCAVTSTGTATGDSGVFFDIEMVGNDGLRVDTVCACSAADTSTNKCTTAVECMGTFNDYGAQQDWCSDSSWNPWLWANACAKVWLDGDGHGNCNHLEVDGSNDNFTTCQD